MLNFGVTTPWLRSVTINSYEHTQRIKTDLSLQLGACKDRNVLKIIGGKKKDKKEKELSKGPQETLLICLKSCYTRIAPSPSAAMVVPFTSAPCEYQPGWPPAPLSCPHSCSSYSPAPASSRRSRSSPILPAVPKSTSGKTDHPRKPGHQLPVRLPTFPFFFFCLFCSDLQLSCHRTDEGPCSPH